MVAACGWPCQDTKAAEELKPYLKGFCKVCCTGIADVVAFKVERFDGGVVLQEIEQKDMVSGGANRGQNDRKSCAKKIDASKALNESLSAGDIRRWPTCVRHADHQGRGLQVKSLYLV